MIDFLFGQIKDRLPVVFGKRSGVTIFVFKPAGAAYGVLPLVRSDSGTNGPDLQGQGCVLLVKDYPQNIYFRALPFPAVPPGVSTCPLNQA